MSKFLILDSSQRTVGKLFQKWLHYSCVNMKSYKREGASFIGSVALVTRVIVHHHAPAVRKYIMTDSRSCSTLESFMCLCLHSERDHEETQLWILFVTPSGAHLWWIMMWRWKNTSLSLVPLYCGKMQLMCSHHFSLFNTCLPKHL